MLFVVIGSAYCRSLPAQPSDIKIESLSGNPAPLVRRARQLGIWKLFFTNIRKAKLKV